MTRIDDAFTKHGYLGTAYDTYLRPMIDTFSKSAAADQNYLDALAGGDEGQFWSRAWEAMLHARLIGLGWTVSGKGAGPDFEVQTPGGAVLVEATVPSPDGIPDYWLKPPATGNFPSNEILLRWTSSLADKRKKQVDDIAKKNASEDVPYVLAINARRLGYHSTENGITGWPFAVEATFPVGPVAAKIDPETGKLGDPYQSYRFSIPKTSGASVPTSNFIDPTYECVSALIGCSQFYADDATHAAHGGQPRYLVVHNPLAKHPLPANWLPKSVEYVATKTSDDEYTLTRSDVN
jgi:type I restriction enzyme S subunit